MHDEFTQKTPVSRLIVLIVSVVVLITLGIYVGFDLGQKDAATESANTATSEISTTTQATETASPATTQDETADWKTYTNDNYNYSVKYPPAISYKDIPSGVEGDSILDFYMNKDFTYRINAVKNNTGYSTLKDFIKSSSAGLSVDDRNVFTEISINGEPAYKYINHLTDATSKKIGATVLLVKSDFYYQIETGSQYSPEFTKDAESEFDQFVSTFRFTK